MQDWLYVLFGLYTFTGSVNDERLIISLEYSNDLIINDNLSN